jgi:hypothetical protein
MPAYDELGPYQRARFEELMSQPMSEWPSDLSMWVARKTDRIAICGDVIADVVAGWIKTQPI